MKVNGTLIGVDFRRIHTVLVGQGLTESEADQACIECQRDLTIVAENHALELVPSTLSDQAIHVLLELDPDASAFAESVAGPGAKLLHLPDRQGDWEASQRARSERFGGDPMQDNAAGCLVTLKPAGCIVALHPAGCILGIKAAA